MRLVGAKTSILQSLNATNIPIVAIIIMLAIVCLGALYLYKNGLKDI